MATQAARARTYYERAWAALPRSDERTLFAAEIMGRTYFALLETRSPVLIFIAIALSLIPIMTLYGPQAALIAESFEPRLRYSGAGIGYQLASIIAGGPAPFIAAALFAAYQSGYAIAFYILGCGVISIIAAILLKDHTNKDIDEYDVSPL